MKTEPQPKVMRLKGGGWQGRFWYMNQNGERIRFRRQISSNGIKREVEMQVAELKRQADRLGYVPGFNDPPPPPEVEQVFTFSGFAEKFYKKYVLVDNSRNEQRNKESHLRVHLVPYFGDTDIRLIDGEMIAGFKAHMKKKIKAGPPKAKKKSRRSGKPISENSINKHLGTLRIMLNVAYDWGYLKAIPKVKAFRLEKRDPDWYTIEERELFLATCERYRPEWYCFFLVAFHTGARMGELAGLKWGDIQFATKIIRIQRTRDREGNEKCPKSRKSRNVSMNSAVCEALMDHRHLDGDYVFHNSVGRKLDINGGYKVFKWLCRMAGLRALRRHDIRHSFASAVVAKTGNILVVKDELGHSEITTTQIYAHNAPSTRNDAVESIVVPKEPLEVWQQRLSCEKTGKKVATEVATEPPRLKIAKKE